MIVVRDRTATLRGHAQWDADCKSLDPPLVTLVEPPAHGRIDLREGEVVPSGNWFGKTPCNGSRMRGVLVSFVPVKGYRGVDRVRYVVDYGNGTKPQPVRVDIGVR